MKEMKELPNENYKSLNQEIKEDLRDKNILMDQQN
jgi:hypothetical protein